MKPLTISITEEGGENKFREDGLLTSQKKIGARERPALFHQSRKSISKGGGGLGGGFLPPKKREVIVLESDRKGKRFHREEIKFPGVPFLRKRGGRVSSPKEDTTPKNQTVVRWARLQRALSQGAEGKDKTKLRFL